MPTRERIAQIRERHDELRRHEKFISSELVPELLDIVDELLSGYKSQRKRRTKRLRTPEEEAKRLDDMMRRAAYWLLQDEVAVGYKGITKKALEELQDGIWDEEQRFLIQSEHSLHEDNVFFITQGRKGSICAGPRNYWDAAKAAFMERWPLDKRIAGVKHG
jgi:hypothetical protein